MAARSPSNPALTVLQLDTGFPRIVGDVACPDSYREEIEIIRVPARVVQVVRGDVSSVDIEPFERAIRKAKGEIITTSCGFLAPWNDHLAAMTDRPFLASVLNAPPVQDALILTFDADALGAAHLTGWQGSVVGLPPAGHLRAVIGGDLAELDPMRAEAEVVGLAHMHLTEQTSLMLECTNLPPYAPALRMATERPVHHILTALEALRPGLVNPLFLTAS